MEDLAYRRLLDVYYMREGPLPADIQVTAKLVRMRSMAADVESVLREFFTLTDEGWTHPCCDSENAKMQAKQEKARASGVASSKARKAFVERLAKAKSTDVAEKAANVAEKATDVERALDELATDVQLPTTTTTTTTTTIPKDYGADAPPSFAGAPEIRPEVQICIALRQAGIGDTNANHPLLSALVEAGATVGEFLGMAAKAEGKGNGFAYVLAAVRGERERAKATGGEIHNGPLRIVDRVALTVPQSPGSVAAAATREAEERAHAEQVAAVTPERRAAIKARLADSMARMGVRA